MTSSTRRAKAKPDDKAQSKAFIEKAREIEADEERSAADNLIGRLAKEQPKVKTIRKRGRGLTSRVP